MILVINSGSSSIKYKLFNKNNQEVYSAIEEEVRSHSEAIKNIFSKLIQNNIIESFESLEAVGHRVVHGGEKFSKPVIIDKNVIEDIKKLIPLAPLHNPTNLEAIQIIYTLYPTLKQIAVFDTAYHQTIPPKNYIYPLEYRFYKENHIRRYGFHGTSHHYVAKKAAGYLDKNIEDCNFISLHLGNGTSICSIKNGKSYDTSMGFTPLEGLMMGTRCGDIDPAIVLYMQNSLGLDSKEIDIILNKKSGFLGICGKSDLREIIDDAKDDEQSKLALEIYIEKIVKYIGGYFLQLGKIDGIIFTGGIGQNSPYIRGEICKALKPLGIEIDDISNKTIKDDIFKINSTNSIFNIIVVKTDEEKQIAIETRELI